MDQFDNVLTRPCINISHEIGHHNNAHKKGESIHTQRALSVLDSTYLLIERNLLSIFKSLIRPSGATI